MGSYRSKLNVVLWRLTTRVFAALDHLPALDPERVPTREKLYRPPEDAINPDAPKGEKKIW